MKGIDLLKKIAAYLGTALLLNLLCLGIAHFGWLHIKFYVVILVLAIGVFLLYYWAETYAHTHFHCKRVPFALVVLLSQFLLSFYTCVIWCKIFGLTYKKFGSFRINDAEWMLTDIYCIILHVIVLRIAIGVLHYILRVMKSKDPF